MIINGKRIRNIDKYLSEFQEGEHLYIGLQNVEMYCDEVRKYGLLGDLSEKYAFLPRPIKSVTNFNANGRWVIDKSVPREDRTFESEYHIVDWHGNDHYGTRYCTKKCYHSNLIPPPEIELIYTNGLLLSPLLIYTHENKNIIKHTINMYLEMFGVCETLTEKYTPKQTITMERLTWTVFPKGEYPWKKAKSYLGAILNTIPTRHKAIISKRHEAIAKNVPDFMAIGDQGFWGYVIYGFIKKGIFIFESNKPNNATYVFRGNWKQASKLTKSEILSGQLQEARIIHDKKWNNGISKLIS
ncbi:hypothetical protein [Clostridium estertheticum]|uniref:Uncharacterized protein n=1 Tax=Clostridium estertheticum subsp. estertheticum TaxID=1552 RepID=A0A1J0GE97_9CLOT|nr:hypothetical protein [Clostridium estertheticum]APC39645.1 hypothetical protein A7L45_05970 [Clostridium estertheticum subsp. estertheticum]MBZ9614320.1 hypothetical protein [Clostridium estertheticum subsp. laramiense]WAG74257.1 hypothetical protein LL032_02020 [Clostridium estertheticum]